VCRIVCTQKHKRLHHDGIVPLKRVLLELFGFLRLRFLTCDHFCIWIMFSKLASNLLCGRCSAVIRRSILRNPHFHGRPAVFSEAEYLHARHTVFWETLQFHGRSTVFCVTLQFHGRPAVFCETLQFHGELQCSVEPCSSREIYSVLRNSAVPRTTCSVLRNPAVPREI
jgi:hypothetical protein